VLRCEWREECGRKGERGSQGKGDCVESGVRGGDVKRRRGNPCFGLYGCLGGGAREGRWREEEEEGRGERRERGREECGCVSSPLFPFLFSFCLSRLSRVCIGEAMRSCVQWRTSGEKRKMFQGGTRKNVPGWNKRCVKLCVLTLALIITDLLCSLLL